MNLWMLSVECEDFWCIFSFFPSCWFFQGQ